MNTEQTRVKHDKLKEIKSIMRFTVILSAFIFLGALAFLSYRILNNQVNLITIAPLYAFPLLMIILAIANYEYSKELKLEVLFSEISKISKTSVDEIRERFNSIYHDKYITFKQRAVATCEFFEVNHLTTLNLIK